MAEEGVTRKLAAILYADVAGYSRLTGRDEEGTHKTLSTYLDAMTTLIEDHGRRVLHYAGDAILAEFASVVVAVTCAVEVQRNLAIRNEDVPDDRKLQFRIGVNLGDVIVDRGELYGDGVNVAARLESMADAGGICVSSDAYRQVRGKLDAVFDDLGEREVKNIAEPVRIYRVRWDAAGAERTESDVDAEPALQLPDKPSIAVLPFNNMSGDPDQDYFADGLTEDIITALSKVRWFFVIARNSTFAYRGSSPDVRRVANNLGVRYVLEGSVRKSGNRVRLTSQLIDGGTGNHIWAERYDRDLEDIFELQDELTQTVVGAIEPQLSKAERERAKSLRPSDLDAWNNLQRGRSHLYRRTREDLGEARKYFLRAIELDGNLGPSYSDLVEVYFLEVRLGLADKPAEHLERAMEIAKRAVELDDEDPAAHYSVGRVLSMMRQHQTAVPELETAIGLNPSFAQAYLGLGLALAYSGHPADAIAPLETAMRLSPHDDYMGPMMARMAEAHLFLRRHEEAAVWARKSVRQPNLPWPGHATLVSILGHLGELDEAKTAVAELVRRMPDVNLGFVREKLPITHLDDLDHLVDGLRRAGVPE